MLLFLSISAASCSTRPPAIFLRLRIILLAFIALLVSFGTPRAALGQANSSFGAGYAGFCKTSEVSSNPDKGDAETLDKSLRTVFTDFGLYVASNDYNGTSQDVDIVSLSRRQCATSFIGTWNLEANVAHVREPARSANAGLLGAGITRKIASLPLDGAVYLTPMVRLGSSGAQHDSQTTLNGSLMLSVVRPLSKNDSGQVGTYLFTDLELSAARRRFKYDMEYGTAFSANQSGVRLDGGVDFRLPMNATWRMRATGAFQRYDNPGSSITIRSLGLLVRPVVGSNDSSPWYAEITFQRGSSNFKGVLLSVIFTELQWLGR